MHSQVYLILIRKYFFHYSTFPFHQSNLDFSMAFFSSNGRAEIHFRQGFIACKLGFRIFFSLHLKSNFLLCRNHHLPISFSKGSHLSARGLLERKTYEICYIQLHTYIFQLFYKLLLLWKELCKWWSINIRCPSPKYENGF